MKALRKGVSPVIATLLLILIAVAAAVLLYTWVSSLSANVAGSQVTGKTLTVIQATWARMFTDGSGTVAGEAAFGNMPVLIISFKAPPAAVGGGQVGNNLITIDNVDVLYAGRVLCHYASFHLSIDDKQHTGNTAGGASGYGLLFKGYVGDSAGALDANDLYSPGGIIVDASNTPGNAAAGYESGYVTSNYANGEDLASFATVVAGTWQVNYVSTTKVETYFNATNAIIRFDRWIAPVDITNNNQVSIGQSGVNYIDTFDLAKVGQDDWSLVIWCRNVNPNTMNEVAVRLQFQDGSTWQTTVPLTVQ